MKLYNQKETKDFRRELRKNLTQEEFAKRARTTQPVIARLESGKDTRVPSLLLLTRLAAAAHTSIRITFEKIKNLRYEKD